jgi:hypothetical protein
MKQQHTPATIRFRGYFAEQGVNNMWKLRGRGERRLVTHSELVNLLNARPKRKGGAR